MPPGHLFHDLRALLHTVDPAHLGPERRACALPLEELDSRLTEAFREATVPPVVHDLLQAVIYLWHDHLAESHRIAQEIDDRDGALVHAIMHRREPDFGNAKYWFRRVGVHPSFLALSVRASELLARHSDCDLHSRLVPNKSWDPFAFVDAAEDAHLGKFPSQVPILEQVQKLEFECLVENLLNRS